MPVRLSAKEPVIPITMQRLEKASNSAVVITEVITQL